MKATSSKEAISIAALLAAMTAPTSEARSYGHVMGPRASYKFNRDPMDLVSEIFRAPIYFNSMMKQQQEALSKKIETHTSSHRYHISEGDDGLMQLEMEVPGVLAKDLTVELEDDRVLRIQGTRNRGLGAAASRESAAEEFDMSFQLDQGVDADRMKVTLSAGILRVTVPKKEKTVKRLEITTTVEEDTVPVLEGQTNDGDAKEGSSMKVEEVDGLTIMEGEESEK